MDVYHKQVPWCRLCHVGVTINMGYCQGRRNEKRARGGGQNLLKGTDKILIMLKSIPWNLEGQLHSYCAKFLPIIFLA